MTRYTLTLLLLSVFLIAGINTAEAESKGDLESTVAQSIMTRNSGDRAIAGELYAKDVIYNLVDQVPSELKGMDAIMDYYDFLRTAYPDMKYTVKHMTVDGNTVIAESTFTGTNTGPRGDQPPTNKKVTFSSISLSLNYQLSTMDSNQP